MPYHATRTIKASSERLWELLTHTSHWHRWGPSIKSVSSDTPIIALGTRGIVRTALLPIELPFVITEYTHMSSWSWEVAGRQATTHTLRQLAPDLCEVSFGVPSAIFVPYLTVCYRALSRIADMA